MVNTMDVQSIVLVCCEGGLGVRLNHLKHILEWKTSFFQALNNILIDEIISLLNKIPRNKNKKKIINISIENTIRSNAQ